MNKMQRKINVFFGLLLTLTTLINQVAAQVTVTSSDSLSCTTPCTVLEAHLVGDSPTPTGISVDDIYSGVLPIGFTFNYYGVDYTSVVIGPNGTVCFDLTLAGAYDPWPISAALLGNTSKLNNICGPWCDIDISTPDGGTITYSLTGVAPNRKYIVTFCNDRMFSCTDQITSTQIILYETTNNIEVHVATKPICATWNSGRAIIGVQNATGTAATVAPGRDFPASYVCTDEAWRFVQDASGTSYTVSSIPYAPIPFASSSIYWYNETTGAYLGTGLTQTVCPTSTTTYKAGALGCADTSFGYYTVSPAPFFTVSLSSTDPSMCEVCDGTITVSGFTPGLLDTIDYEMGGVPQPTVYAVANAAGEVTITGLCDGTYDNFVGRQGICASVPAGPITLSNPGITISGFTPTAQSICGACDGEIIVNGLYPSHAFTLNYNYNGVPQPPISTITTATGNILLSGLCEGVYDNFVASYSGCTTPPAGPVSLFGPPPPAAIITNVVHPSQCGFCDGSLTLRAVAPFSSDTINYSFNGSPQPPFITSALGDSTIYLPGLCSGIYSAMTIKIGRCVTNVLGMEELIDPPLTASFDTTLRLGCNGDTVFFHNGSSSTGALHYVWNFGDGNTDTASNPYHVYGEGTFHVSLLATNHSCYDSATMDFTLGHPLTSTFSNSPSLLCQHEAVTFTNESVGATGYLWSFGNGATSTVSDPSYTYNNSGKYTISLVASNDIPCYDTAYASVQVDTISGIRMQLTDTVFCAGTYITMTGEFAELGSTGVTWDFGDGQIMDNVNPVHHAYGGKKQYTITARAHYRACPEIETSRTVTVFPQPTIELGPDTSICKGSSAITLSDKNNSTNPVASWVWNTGETTSSINIVAPGVYRATVNIDNCHATDSILVSSDCYVDIPNVFTPNGDGVNDYFFPRQLLSRGLIVFRMSVFNRWGQLIFESNSLNGAGWDGKLNGTDQPEGVYVYSIEAEFKDGQREHHKGNVTLMR